MSLAALDFLELAAPDTLMAIIHVYLDESGKFHKAPVVSLSGVMGTRKQADAFNESWESELRQNGLSCLKMSDMLKFNKPLSVINQEIGLTDRTKTMLRFVRIIKKHFEHGFTSAVDVESHRDPAIERFLGVDPFYTAFHRLLFLMLKCVRRDDTISVICDHDESTAAQCYQYYRRFRSLVPEAGRKLVSMSFSDDNVFTPLQAADMLASLVRLEATRKFTQKEHDFWPVLEAFQKEPTSTQRMRCHFGFHGPSELSNLSAGYRNLTERIKAEFVSAETT